MRILANGFGRIAILLRNQAQPNHGHGAIWCQLQRSLEILLRSGDVTQLTIGGSQIAVGGGAKSYVSRMESDHLVAFDGCPQITVAVFIGSEIQIGG